MSIHGLVIMTSLADDQQYIDATAQIIEHMILKWIKNISFTNYGSVGSKKLEIKLKWPKGHLIILRAQSTHYFWKFKIILALSSVNAVN